MDIVLVGNRNVGKSVLFSALTGLYAHATNYPGTTVEIARGRVGAGPHGVTLIDTPGINSLTPMSEDEQVTRDILLDEKIAGVVQVAEAKNLRRALVITVQLAEMGIPFLLDLNMADEAASRGIQLDPKKLAALLGVPVVETVAIQKQGLKEIRKGLTALQPSTYRHRYSPDIEAAVATLGALLPDRPIAPRALALMILSGDKTLLEWLQSHLSPEALERIDRIKTDLDRRHHEPLAYRIQKERLRQAEALLHKVLRQEGGDEKGAAVWLGRVTMHPVWGVPILLGVLVLVYEFVGKLGAQTMVGWLENGLFGDYLNPWAIRFFSSVFSFSPFLRDLIVGPYGVITMALTYALAIVLPIVTTFFIAFSLIEDSGYLPRLAIILNRGFRVVGLNGKAVVPMVLGLGCDTMATMAARIMDTKKERIILTLLLALAVPCSAQLGIILGMLATLPLWATFLWLGVVAGVLIVVGFLSARVLPGYRSDFVMEIPPIRRPLLGNVLKKTAARLEWYLREVVPLFILGTLVLFFLDWFALLPVLERWGRPLVVRLLALPPEATGAFLIGFLRRDYGATRFFDLYRQGGLDVIQAVVSLIVMTLFVPCLANTLMIVKERGIKTAVWMVTAVYTIAFLVGGAVNWGLRL